MRFVLGKKASHVGMMLSFAIFIFALVFLYSIIIFATNAQEKDQFLVDILKDKIIKDISSEVIITTIKIEEGTELEENCIEIHNFYEALNSSMVTKDSRGNILGTYYHGNSIYIEEDDNLFLRIYKSREFAPLIDGGAASCDILLEGDEGNYKLGLSKKQNEIFESKLNSLLDEDYEDLRNRLGFPDTSEFNIKFTYENGTIIEKDVNSYGEVYSKELSIIYLDEKAEVNQGTLMVRVW